MKVVVLAPITTSLYSRVVTLMALQTPGITVSGVAVRTPWSRKRARAEFRRDGARLLMKVYRQLLLGTRAFDPTTHEHLLGLATEQNLAGRSLKGLCRKYNVPCKTFSDHNDADCIAFLRDLSPDVIAFTGGGLIRSELLSIPSKGVLNCHMGPLPRYRGLDVVEYPVVEGRMNNEGTGLTLQFMDKGIDTGPILIRRKVMPRPGDSFPTLRNRMQRAMVDVMIEGIEGLRDGVLEPQPQRVDDGRQYYVMHKRISDLAAHALAGFASEAAEPADDRSIDRAAA